MRKWTKVNIRYRKTKCLETCYSYTSKIGRGLCNRHCSSSFTTTVLEKQFNFSTGELSSTFYSYISQVISVDLTIISFAFAQMLKCFNIMIIITYINYTRQPAQVGRAQNAEVGIDF